ncbi:DUF6933 domain-containing protein [Nafulsella turpanensis]|uniref:DUF6933 domain-containing protein n=1 Tax=Nafulsella turpanensis TaxID=1265690 RepID=UPI00034502E1|nr:hypothetical protein [Nafulsella turpanensis]
MIKLYQTKKLKGHLSNSFYQDLPDASGQETDPILSWYGDIFYINRKMNLIFTNELTKFSILILKYKKSDHPDFAATFRQYLAFTMRLHSLDPEKYLEHTDSFGLNTKSNRSPIAHLSRLKIDFTPTLHFEYNYIETEPLWIKYTQAFNSFYTSYPGRKSYYEPAEVMKDELEKRGLLR